MPCDGVQFWIEIYSARGGDTKVCMYLKVVAIGKQNCEKFDSYMLRLAANWVFSLMSSMYAWRLVLEQLSGCTANMAYCID